MNSRLFGAAVAGSLPKPAWLAEANKRWQQWRAQALGLGAALARERYQQAA